MDEEGNCVSNGEWGEEYYINYCLLSEDIGDLDGDNLDDAIVTFETSYGGNLVTQSLVVLLNKDGNIVPTVFLKEFETHFLIDNINNQIIYCTKEEYAEDDPTCCPSIIKKLKYKLINNKLVEVN